MNWLKMTSIVLGVSVITGIAYLNSNGFCYSKRRFLTDNEFIGIAIDYNLSHETNRAPLDAGNKIQYASPAVLISKNPNCCMVRREDRGLYENILDGKWVRVFGLYVLAVEAWYPYYSSGFSRFYESSLAINACGHVLDRMEAFGPTLIFPTTQTVVKGINP